jgi:hypothetical protein
VEKKMTDIVDRLRGYAEVSDITGAYTEANCAYDAIEEIKRLRSALHKIGYDYVELSHEKVQLLYLEHIAIARKAYQESFPEQQPAEKKPLDNNF